MNKIDFANVGDEGMQISVKLSGTHICEVPTDFTHNFQEQGRNMPNRNQTSNKVTYWSCTCSLAPS